ncbi:MAG TPA: sigma-70 family RNA polymerase sigma factor [Gaiellaceae bacterium]|nr:sigma-70 family RNA polymerase sigma factor [Gaiellaceae bacterium]
MQELAAAGEQGLVDALRRGDEEAFASLVEELSPSMLRVARLYVPTQAIAEDVVQEAWVGVLRGIDRFESRSSLRTWIFRILTNIAKTRGIREGRSVPFSSLGGDEPAVDPERFLGGHWAAPPRAWEGGERLEAKETLDLIESEIAKLPPAQGVVITMRDIEGFDSEEVRNVLGVSETNQRVLLHRARSKVRRALEEYMA